MSVSNKLSYLNTTKQEIKQKLNNLGAGLTNSDTFRSYASSLKDIYAKLPKVSDMGDEITLTPTLEARLGLIPRGNAFQQTYSGKNLFNPYIATTTKNGVTISYDEENQVLTLNGTCTQNNTTFGFSNIPSSIDLINKTLYSYIVYVSGSSSNYFNFRVFTNLDNNLYNSVQNGVSENVSASKTYSVSTQMSAIDIRVNADSTFNNLKVKLGVSIVDNLYEPYTGGQASPNPSYPQNISVVTGENSVKVQSRNLLDLEKYPYSSTESILNGATVSIENGIITADATNATAMPTIKSYTPASTDRTTIPAGTYYFGVRTNGMLMDGDTTTFKQFSEGVNTVEYPYKMSQWFFPCSTGQITTKTLLISLDSTKTTYVEHQEQNYPLSLGNIELAKIGDYEDYIEGTPDNWKKKEVIKKIRYNDAASIGGDFNTMKQNGYLCRYFANDTIAMNADRTLILSNRFKGKQAGLWNGTNGEGIQIGITSSAIFVAMAFETLQDYYGQEITSSNFYTAWQSYLNNNETYIWYPLMEPIDVPITGTTLISQLNALYYANSYDDETNISSTYATGNMPMRFTASALKGE